MMTIAEEFKHGKCEIDNESHYEDSQHKDWFNTLEDLFESTLDIIEE